MSVELMRTEVLKAYPGPKWSGKVKKMADGQILAIFYRMRQQGIIK